MALKATFKKGDIKKALKAWQLRFENRILSSLEMVGEQFIADARTSGSYTDQTGNLRSSIGYLILKNGKIVRSAFSEGGNGTDRATGVKTAEAYARKLAKEFKSAGFTFIGVAGMDYALAVESKGREVITQSSKGCEKTFEKYLVAIKKHYDDGYAL